MSRETSLQWASEAPQSPRSVWVREHKRLTFILEETVRRRTLNKRSTRPIHNVGHLTRETAPHHTSRTKCFDSFCKQPHDIRLIRHVAWHNQGLSRTFSGGDPKLVRTPCKQYNVPTGLRKSNTSDASDACKTSTFNAQ